MIFFLAQLVYLHRKGEGSLLWSEFESPRKILIKQQQQHQIFFKKNWKKITLDRVPSTHDIEPSTLDKKIDSPRAGRSSSTDNL